MQGSTPAPHPSSDGSMAGLSASLLARPSALVASTLSRRGGCQSSRSSESVSRLYDSVGLELLVRVTPFSQPEGIDAELARLGFAAHEETCVMVATTVAGRPARTCPGGHRIEPLSHRSLAETVGLFRGTALAGREAHAERLQESPVPFSAFAVLDRNGGAVACGQYAVEAELVGLYDVFTSPASRSLGLATALCEHLLAESAAHGGETAYLQVEGTNVAARRIYERLGFEVAYTYHYRIRPSHAAGIASRGGRRPG